MKQSRSWAYNYYNICFAVICAFILMFLIYLAPYGYNGYDESFYLTVPYRLVQGDALLKYEWHPAQFVGFLMYPVMWVYLKLAGSTDGIYLAFRYIYIAAQLLAAVYIYIRLKKTAPLGAIFAAAVYFLFVPYSRLTLSYNTLAIMLLLLSEITAATAKKNAAYFMSGLMFAGAVLCCPYLAAVYAIYTLALLIRKISKHGKMREWLYFTAGCAVLAVIFLAVILINATPNELLDGIKNTLNDPEHSEIKPLKSLGLYIKHVFFSRASAKMLFFGCLVLILLIRLDKKSKEHKWLYMSFAALIAILHLAITYKSYRYINYYTLSLCMPGLIAYLLHKNRPKKIFFLVYLPGWLFSYCKCLSSNQFYYAITEGLSVACAASAFIIGSLIHESLSENNKTKQAKITSGASCAISALAVAVLCCVLVLDSLEIREGNCRTTGRDYKFTLTEQMQGSVADGLYATVAENENYKRYLAATEKVRNYEGKNVLYFSWELWLYMADSKDNAAFSAWLSFTQEDMAAERLLDYWSLHPEKLPDAIFIDKDFINADVYAKALNTENFPVEENDLGYIMLRPEQ